MVVWTTLAVKLYTIRAHKDRSVAYVAKACVPSVSSSHQRSHLSSAVIHTYFGPDIQIYLSPHIILHSPQIHRSFSSKSFSSGVSQLCSILFLNMAADQ